MQELPCKFKSEVRLTKVKTVKSLAEEETVIVELGESQSRYSKESRFQDVGYFDPVCIIQT